MIEVLNLCVLRSMKCEWIEPAEWKLVLVLLFPVLPNETFYVAPLLNAVLVLTLV